MRSVANLAREQFPPDRGFELALDHPPERPRTVDRVVAMLGEVVARLIGQFELDLALFEALAQPLDLNIDDLAQLFLVQRMEHDDLVDAVQELRPEMLPQRLHRLL